MAKYSRVPFRFNCKGIQLSREPDDTLPEKFPILKNVRVFKGGVLQARPGETAYNATPMADLSINTVKRLNNDLASAVQAFTIILGSGSSLYSDNNSHNAFISRASGFSTNPKCIVPFRPNNSPEPFAYIADSLKMGKLKVDGTFRNMGIPAPSSHPAGPSSPVPVLDTYQFTTIDTGLFGSAASWTADGTGFTAVADQTIALVTMTAVLYDVGTTGMASVILATIPAGTESFHQAGTMITTTTAAETVMMNNIFKAPKTTTIASIEYDTGTTGLCSIQPTSIKRKTLIKDAIYLINSGGGTAENVRILDVSYSPDGIPSIRVSTVNTHAAGETLTGRFSWRTTFVNNHAAAETYPTSTLRFDSAILPANSSLTGFGTRTVALDLGTISNRPIQDEDEINFLIKLDAGTITPMIFTDIQILLDCGNGSFTENYFLISLRSSDFTSIVGTNPAISTTIARQTAIQKASIDDTDLSPEETASQLRERLQRRLRKAIANGNLSKADSIRERLGIGSTPDSSSPSSIPTSIGVNQFIPIRVKIKDITRVGPDFTKDWGDINHIRIRATMLNPYSTVNSAVVYFGAFWIGGTFSPNVDAAATPYIHRYRYRSSESGAVSFPSAANRSGILAVNSKILLVAEASTDPQVDKIDWFRFGGTINDWRYLGTGPNSTNTFTDNFPDDAIFNNEGLAFDTFQPFPIAGLPVTGICRVSGSTVVVTTGSVSLAMAPGTTIIINGTPYTLYAIPTSSTKFKINENAGSQTNVSLFIPEPILMGQPLPAMWGPFVHEGELGSVMFACGDTNNPGTLYWTNPNDPDSASDLNFLEITSPSEPLMNGFVYDSRAWVFSSEELYQIYPTRTAKGKLTFQATKTGLGLGLAGRYALCAFKGKIAFVSKEGIFLTEGHSPLSITDSDLYSLFPHDGQIGEPLNTYIAPDFTQPNSLRLAEGASELRFDYKGVDSNSYTLIYDELLNGWLFDSYAKPVLTSYWEEIGKASSNGRWLLGSNDGKLYILSGTSDGGSAIICQVRTKSEDGGDFRTKKKMGDFIVDYDPQGVIILAQIGFDNYSSLPLATSLVATSGRRQQIVDINNGEWTYAKNAAIDLSWASLTLVPKLYGYEFSAIQTPEDVQKRATDADNAGVEGAKFWQGFRLRINSYNTVKSFKVQADNGLNNVWNDIESFTVQSNGESIVPFSFTTPYIAHLSRIIGLDNNSWSLIDVEWVCEPEPEMVENWITQQSTLDGLGYGHIGFLQITLLSTAQANLVIVVDGVAQAPLAIASTGGLRLKRYVRLPAIKGKTWQFKLTSNVAGTGFRVYQRDLECAYKIWSSTESYQIKQPFGDLSRLRGAAI